jgi:hypothetical protein
MELQGQGLRRHAPANPRVSRRHQRCVSGGTCSQGEQHPPVLGEGGTRGCARPRSQGGGTRQGRGGGSAAVEPARAGDGRVPRRRRLGLRRAPARRGGRQEQPPREGHFGVLPRHEPAPAGQARRGPQARDRGRRDDEAAPRRRAVPARRRRISRRPDPLAGLQGSEGDDRARRSPRRPGAARREVIARPGRGPPFGDGHPRPPPRLLSPAAPWARRTSRPGPGTWRRSPAVSSRPASAGRSGGCCSRR